MTPFIIIGSWKGLRRLRTNIHAIIYTYDDSNVNLLGSFDKYVSTHDARAAAEAGAWSLRIWPALFRCKNYPDPLQINPWDPGRMCSQPFRGIRDGSNGCANSAATNNRSVRGNITVELNVSAIVWYGVCIRKFIKREQIAGSQWKIDNANIIIELKYIFL